MAQNWPVLALGAYSYPGGAMNATDVRDAVRGGNTQSTIDVENLGVLLGFTFIFGAITGYREDSWWIFLGVWLGSLFLMSLASNHGLPTALWGFAVGAILTDWVRDCIDYTEILSPSGRTCVLIVSFLLGLGFTWGGLQAIHDNKDAPELPPLLGAVGNTIVQAVGLSAILYVHFYGWTF